MWLRVLAVLALAGCKVTGTFHCESADQCSDHGSPGACESDGLCSQADLTCASGRRYDPSAGGEAGHCVAALPIDAGIDAAPDAAMWACGIEPPAPPTTVTSDVVNTTGAHTTITLMNTTFDGQLRSVVPAGAKLTLVTDYSIVDCICPTCVDQIQVGFVPGPKLACIFDGVPDPNTACMTPATGHVMKELDVPTTPGVYDLRFRLGQDFSCTPTQQWWTNTPPDASLTVATICVQ